MNAIRACLIIALVIVSAAIEASTIFGPGAASCGTWVADRQRNQSVSQQNQAWVLGFMTAYNVYKPPTQVDVPKSTDTRKLMVWIDNYCDANPLKDIVDGAKAYIEELEGRAP